MEQLRAVAVQHHSTPIDKTLGFLAANADLKIELVEAVLQFVNSGRSAVAMNGMLCLQDMFATLGPKLDLIAGPALGVTLKISASSNKFLANASANTVKVMVQHGTPHKLLRSLLQHDLVRSKEPRLRTATLSGILQVCLRIGPKLKGFRKLKVLLQEVARSLDFRTPQVKLEARKIAHLVMNGRPGEWPGISAKALSKLMTASQFE